MTEQEFFKYAYHADNLSPDFIENNLDWDEIRQLPSEVRLIKNALLMWSQFMVGNTTDPTKGIKKLRKIDRRRVLRTWIDITADEQQLRHIAIFAIQLLTE